MNKKVSVSNEVFDKTLENIIDCMTGKELLSIPGIYEILSEELNNNVLEEIAEKEEGDEDGGKGE